MGYKQNVLLKEPSGELLKANRRKGVAKFEDGEKKTLTVSTVGVSGDNLRVKYSIDGYSEEFEFKNRSEGKFLLSADAITGGGVLIYDERTLTPILYGAFSAIAPTLDEMLENGFSYDDETVATENYYEYDKNTRNYSNNKLIGGDIENEHGVGMGDKMPRKEDFGENAQKETDFRDDENGSLADYKIQPEKAGGNFFFKIKEDLESVFKNNPEEKDLKKTVQGSRWAKVFYGDGKHYVVGVIYDKSLPKWICYGVPGVYGEKPTELKGYASFVPSSLFSPKSAGYWVMFQDAESGESID